MAGYGSINVSIYQTPKSALQLILLPEINVKRLCVILLANHIARFN